MRLMLLAALAMVGTGCAGAFRIGGPRLPYEAKVWLLDAEEELLTARARTEEAQVELKRAEKALDAADDRLHDVKELEELQPEARAGRKLALAKVKWREALLALAEKGERCAELGYGAAHADSLVRYRVDGADEREVTALKERAAACELKLKPLREEVAVAEEERDTLESTLERTAVAASAKQPVQRPRPYLE